MNIYTNTYTPSITIKPHARKLGWENLFIVICQVYQSVRQVNELVLPPSGEMTALKPAKDIRMHANLSPA